jgi:hypothetical protein
MVAAAQEFPETVPTAASPYEQSEGVSSVEQGSPNELTLRIGSPESLTKHYQGWWQVQTEMETRDENMDQEVGSVIKANVNFNIKLSPMFAIRLAPSGVFRSRRLQQRIENDDNDSNLNAGDSFFQFVPIHFFELRVGSLAQAFLSNNELVSEGKAFPGLMEMGHIDFDRETHLDIVAEQVVPTSSSLNTDRESREPLPIFQTQMLNFRFEPKDGLGFKANAGHYSWNQLPSKVAYESQLLGNEPGSTGCDLEACSKFNYNFDGFFGGGMLNWSGPGWGINGAFTRVLNTAAPTGRRNAQDIRLEPYLDKKFYRTSLAADYFFSESDVTPALYTSGRFGNTNREGYAITAKVRFKKYGFSLYGQYVAADPLLEASNQFHLTTAILGVETDYASF